MVLRQHLWRHGVQKSMRFDSYPLKMSQVCFPKPARLFSSAQPSTASYRRFGQDPPYIGRPYPYQAAYDRFGGQRRPNRGFDSQAKYLLLGTLLFGGGYVIVHLERVPSTGRLRFIDVSVEMEKAIGEQTFHQILQEYRGKFLPASDHRVQYVRRVAQRIIAATKASHDSGILDADHLPWTKNDEDRDTHGRDWLGSSQRTDDTEWQVFVIQSQEKNAFVLPNGKIFVFSGILPICQDEDGLATVIGHEVAHQVARHIAEKTSGYKIIYFGELLVRAFFGYDFGLSRTITTLLVSLPNSRTLEIEADRLGLRLMSAACFNPQKAPSLWERMQEAEGGGKGAMEAIISTHPLSSQRMRNLQEWLPEATRIREDSNCPSQAALAGFRSSAGNGGLAAFPIRY